MSLSESEDDPLIGRTIDKYEIVRAIGQGGMGTVYEAVNASIGKRVAIKVIDRELAQSEESIARFQREAQAAGAVESAHIIDVIDVGASGGTPFLVMELLRGEDLGHRIRRLGRLEVNEALVVTAQILRGLARAHEAGIVHRDLKPDNVFLVDRDDDSTFVKILDFGISKIERKAGVPTKTLTREGVVLGTPYYMAPEQAQGLADVDTRADLWSVGAILYESLSGRPPFTGGTYEQVIVRICSHDAEDVRQHNSLVPESVAKVLQIALDRERENRFPSAKAFLDALADASGGVVSSRRSKDGTPTPTRTLDSNPGGHVGLASTIAAPPVKAVSAAARARAKRRSYVLVAVGSIALGAGLAFAYSRKEPNTVVVKQPTLGVAPPSASTVASAVSIALEANAPSPRFFLDGHLLDEPTVQGERGAKRRVRVEADGYAALDTEVTLDGATLVRRFDLAPLPPPPVSTATASAKASAKAPPKPPPDRPGGLQIRKD